MTSGQSYVVLCILSALVSIGVGSYAWRKRAVAGARGFAVSALSQAWWIVGHALEISSERLEGKLVWDDLQFFGSAGWVVAFFWFSLEYTSKKLRYSRAVWGVTSAIVGGYLLLVLTDSLHQLVRPSVELVQREGELELVYPFTTATWIAFLYMMLLFGASLWFIAGRALRTQKVYRVQNLMVIGGTLIPIVGVTLTMAGVSITSQRDTSPITFALSNLVIAFGLFRFRFLDLAPIAREIVLESMRDVVVVLDESNRIVDLNRTAAEAAGKPVDELIGLDAAEAFAPWAKLVRRFRDVEELEAELDVEAGGELRHVVQRITPIRDEKRRLLGRVLITHDVTRLKQAEAELQRRNELLESLNRELDAFSHSVSHDLRAPLRTIESFARIVLDEKSEALDAQTRDYLSRVLGGAERMQRMIVDLLEFARLGQQPVKKELVEPAALVGEVMDELGPPAALGKLELSVGRLPACCADPALLRRVLANLLGNAVKFSKSRDPMRIEVGCRELAGKPTYFVRDNGVGFDMRDSDRLFGAFQRLHEASEFEGSGVGLAMSSRIIHRHGGRIWAEAEPDKGATLYFTLGNDS
jgi:PAS domain S-box-containing protein